MVPLEPKQSTPQYVSFRRRKNDNPSKAGQVDYWPAVRNMIEADIGSGRELVYRYFIICISSLCLTYATGNALFAFFLGAFLITYGFYNYFLSKQHAPVRLGRFLLLHIALISSNLIYIATILVLFNMDGLAYKTVGVSALLAQAIFNLSRHRYNTLASIYETILVGATGIYVGLSMIDPESQSPAEQAMVLIVVLGTISYLVIAQYRNVTTQQELLRYQTEAEHSHKLHTVGKMTAGISHDFNNLLTVIRGNIELAELHPNAEDTDIILRDAKEAANRAAEVTSQLLSYSRKVNAPAELVELGTFWRNLEPILRCALPSSCLLQIRGEEYASFVFCRSGRLETAVLNLVLNASDAMDGRGNITLCSRAASEADIANTPLQTSNTARFTVLEVIDDGPGIPADLMDQVKEPFFTTKPEGEGSGLGLSMVESFARDTGGCMRILSGPAGTTVMLILPNAAY